MEFCPKCGTRIVLRPRSFHVHRCLKCGFKIKLASKKNLNQRQNYRGFSHSTIAVLDEGKLKLNTFPTVDAPCPGCGNGRAETWTVPIGSEGTSSVTFLRCTSCGRTRREKD